MLEKAIGSYYHFFDYKIRSSTAVVLLIACMICGVGSSVSGYEIQNYKANIWEVSDKKIHQARIMIDGVEYEIILNPLQK